jgi:hypothetical protein
MSRVKRKTTTANVVEELQPIASETEIKFSTPNQVKMFCGLFDGNQISGLGNGLWCNRAQTLEFLKVRRVAVTRLVLTRHRHCRGRRHHAPT